MCIVPWRSGHRVKGAQGGQVCQSGCGAQRRHSRSGSRSRSGSARVTQARTCVSRTPFCDRCSGCVPRCMCVDGEAPLRPKGFCFGETQRNSLPRARERVMLYAHAPQHFNFSATES